MFKDMRTKNPLVNLIFSNIRASSNLLAISSSYERVRIILSENLLLRRALHRFVEAALKLSIHHRTPISSVASMPVHHTNGLSADRTFGPEGLIVDTWLKHFSDWSRSLNEGNREGLVLFRRKI